MKKPIYAYTEFQYMSRRLEEACGEIISGSFINGHKEIKKVVSNLIGPDPAEDTVRRMDNRIDFLSKILEDGVPRLSRMIIHRFFASHQIELDFEYAGPNALETSIVFYDIPLITPIDAEQPTPITKETLIGVFSSLQGVQRLNLTIAKTILDQVWNTHVVGKVESAIIYPQTLVGMYIDYIGQYHNDSTVVARIDETLPKLTEWLKNQYDYQPLSGIKQEPEEIPVTSMVRDSVSTQNYYALAITLSKNIAMPDVYFPVLAHFNDGNQLVVVTSNRIIQLPQIKVEKVDIHLKDSAWVKRGLENGYLSY